MTPRPTEAPPAVPQHVAVAWYSPQDWAEIKRLAADPGEFHPTYDAWLSALLDLAPVIRTDGGILRVVTVQPEALVSWAAERHLPLNAASRSRYVAERAQQGFDEPFPLLGAPPA